MSTVLRALEFLGLSIWLGSDIFLSFVVAPGAFSVLASRDQAGAIVGYSLARMHFMGIACGVTILLFRVSRARSLASLVEPAAFCVVLMVLLTTISQVAVSPKMAALRVQMGSIEATSKRSTEAKGAKDPLLEEFNRLHTISVGLESGVLLVGMTALFWMVKETGHT
jgi:uncharacterized membrane protein